MNLVVLQWLPRQIFVTAFDDSNLSLKKKNLLFLICEGHSLKRPSAVAEQHNKMKPKPPNKIRNLCVLNPSVCQFIVASQATWPTSRFIRKQLRGRSPPPHPPLPNTICSFSFDRSDFAHDRSQANRTERQSDNRGESQLTRCASAMYV